MKTKQECPRKTMRTKQECPRKTMRTKQECPGKTMRTKQECPGKTMRTKQECPGNERRRARCRMCLILYCMYMINIQSRFDYNISLLAGCLASLSSALHSATSRSSASFFC